MFLGAGSVMHGMNDDVDMRHYGALRRVMPITFVTFAAGYLAIIGFPFLSGYYSKDHIIEAAFERSALVGLLAMLGAGITAFYMTRVMLMTFFGQKRWLPGVHPHESPPVMTVPLIVLGACSVVGGLVLNNWISGWLDPAFGGEHSRGGSAGLLHFSLVGHGHPGGGGHRRRHRGLRVRTAAARSRWTSRPADRRSPWPAATTSTATPSTRRSSCGPGSSSPTV